jgi:hypothetical protein
LDADPRYLCRSDEAPSLLSEPGESFSAAREVGRGMNVMILSVAAVVDDGAPEAVLVADNAGRRGHGENISRKASCVKGQLWGHRLRFFTGGVSLFGRPRERRLVRNAGLERSRRSVTRLMQNDGNWVNATLCRTGDHAYCPGPRFGTLVR